MKKSFIALIVLLSLGSCKVKEKAVAYAKEHCHDSYVRKLPNGAYKLHAKCTDLYDTKEMSKYVQEGVIVFNFGKASVTTDITSSDSIPNLYGILKTVVDGFKK